MKCESGEYKIILDYLRDCGGWVLAGKVRSVQTPYGFIGFRGDRNVRDLIKAGKLKKKMEGKFCWVRFRAEKTKEKPNTAEISGVRVPIFRAGKKEEERLI